MACIARHMTLDSIIFGRMPKMWYRRKSKIGIAPGVHRAGLLHESDMSGAVALQMTSIQWAASAGPGEDGPCRFPVVYRKSALGVSHMRPTARDKGRVYL